MSICIGEYLLARLSEMGVRHMFGVPGDFNLWFLEQTIREGSINFIGCCNELNAAYAADGYSRLAGISALATTYGVGELASLSAVAGAYAERVPIVCITGAPPLPAMQQRALLHHTLADGNYENMLKLGGWANYFNLGPVTPAYRFIDRYTTNRLRRWFCKKHKQPGRGFTHYPDEYLYQKLGLIRLPMLPQNFPWAKA
jgi:TPP-dependent 2-oxoacid decarboxylase